MATLTNGAASAAGSPDTNPGALMESTGGEEEVRTLFVSGLPMDSKARELYHVFGHYEGYQSSTLKPPTSRVGLPSKVTAPVGFVTFDTREHAEVARQALQGHRFDPELPQTLRLEYAKSNTKVHSSKKQGGQHGSATSPPTAIAPQFYHAALGLSDLSSQLRLNQPFDPTGGVLPGPGTVPEAWPHGLDLMTATPLLTTQAGFPLQPLPGYRTMVPLSALPPPPQAALPAHSNAANSVAAAVAAAAHTAQAGGSTGPHVSTSVAGHMPQAAAAAAAVAAGSAPLMSMAQALPNAAAALHAAATAAHHQHPGALALQMAAAQAAASPATFAACMSTKELHLNELFKQPQTFGNPVAQAVSYFKRASPATVTDVEEVGSPRKIRKF